jgi:hypothetical protein
MLFSYKDRVSQPLKSYEFKGGLNSAVYANTDFDTIVIYSPKHEESQMIG